MNAEEARIKSATKLKSLPIIIWENEVLPYIKSACERGEHHATIYVDCCNDVSKLLMSLSNDKGYSASYDKAHDNMQKIYIDW